MNFFHIFQVFSQENSIEIFVDAISSLNPEQKSVVNDLGFSNILGLSCPTIPLQLVHWLINHFDTATRTIQLPNGFSFTINALCVQRILGIPDGPIPIQKKGTLEAYQWFKNHIPCKGRNPTVIELSSLIPSQLSPCDFGRTFLLLALAAFLCPNSRGTCSSRYYPDLLNIATVRYKDWCSFVLDWLISYIEKFQKHRDKIQGNDIAGYLHILLV